MKEYRLICQHGRGKPFMVGIDIYKTFYGVEAKLQELIRNKKDEVNKAYYVTNDFYENKYPAFLNDLTKYTIECREVLDWVEYSEVEEKKKELEENEKIISFLDIKKKVQ